MKEIIDHLQGTEEWQSQRTGDQWEIWRIQYYADENPIKGGILENVSITGD